MADMVARAERDSRGPDLWLGRGDRNRQGMQVREIDGSHFESEQRAYVEQTVGGG
jgi:hypothetical protein